MCNVPDIENAVRSGTGNVTDGMNGTQELVHCNGEDLKRMPARGLHVGSR